MKKKFIATELPLAAKSQRTAKPSPFTLLLDQFVGETKGEERKLTVNCNKAVETLEAEFSKALRKGISTATTAYWEYFQLAEKLSYSPEDVKIFSIRLPQFQTTPSFGQAAGLFLSALMNASKYNDFEIVTKPLSFLPIYLGYENVKNIIVDGGAGNDLGYRANSGRIILNGDAMDLAGMRMTGGEITINGNAGNSPGYGMSNGKLLIHGNADATAGNDMEGGELEIMGNVGRKCGSGATKGKITVHGNAGDDPGYNLNGADVVIKGSCGDNAGLAMVKGTLHIDSATGAHPGHMMHGGTLTLRGRAGNWLGMLMDSGTIIANCPVGESAGAGMINGLIRINGSVVSLAENIHGGRIYQYQRLLVDNGKLIELPLEM